MTASARPLSVQQQRLDAQLISYIEGAAVNDLDDVSIDGLALAAGVSRATAYRYFGDREAMLFRAAVALTHRHSQIALPALLKASTVAAHIEEGLVYAVREMPRDKLLRLVLTGGPSNAIDGVMRDLGMTLSGDRLRSGQLDGQVRDDVSIEDLVAWIIEQQHVMFRRQLDEAAARLWFRRFMLPAIRPQKPEVGLAIDVAPTLLEIRRRVAALRATVDDVRSGIS
jgi:AcrR family transcriptional regulator